MDRITLEQVEDAVSLGESETIEFISVIDEQQLCQTISAFANTGRGSIFVGVKEPIAVHLGPGAAPRSGNLVGVNYDKFCSVYATLRDKFDPECPKLTPAFSPFQTMHDAIFVITVDVPGVLVCLKDGRCFKRVGSKNVPMTDEEKALRLALLRQAAPTSEDEAKSDRVKPASSVLDASVGLVIGGANVSATANVVDNDATMPIVEADFPITANEGSKDVEPKAEAPTREPVTTEAVGEAKATSEVRSVSDSITVSDSVNAAVTGGEESTANAADAKSKGGEDWLSSVRQIGGKMEHREEAAEHEKCLHTNEYAEAIANLFARTEDTEKLSFGLFGHWGRGKTFLIKEVTKRLEQRGYTAVNFSAWKYRTNPECWIHLYETFAASAKSWSWFLPLRVRYVQAGPWPAILAVWSLYVALRTAGHTFDIVQGLYLALGAVGLIWATYLFFRFGGLSIHLKSVYWSLPTHAEKLGLQAAIGNDLQALLLGWLSRKRFYWNRKAGVRTEPLIRWGSMILYWVGCLLVFRQLLKPELKNVLNQHLPEEYRSRLWSDYFDIISAGAWYMLSILLVWVILGRVRHAARSFLVVDDLDRCHPDQMLEIIESVQLLLDDPVISERLQVCMLVDESALAHALIKKYVTLTEFDCGKEHQFSANRVLRENIEKFFQVHLRLPAVSEAELSELIENFTAPPTPKSESVPALKVDPKHQQSGTPHLNRTNENDAPTVVEGIAIGVHTAMPYFQVLQSEGLGSDSSHETPLAQSEQSRSKSDVNRAAKYTEVERNALMSLVSEFKHCDSFGTWGPRSIRRLLFRYQLARELLFALRITDFPPNELWWRLIHPSEKLFSVRYADADDDVDFNAVAVLDRIVKQVW